MLITPAFAANTNTVTSAISQFAPLIIIFVIFYFLLIRPQQKRHKEHKRKLAAIAKGDKIITAGGVEGTVKKTSENTIEVEISKGIVVSVVRSTVLDVIK